MPSEEWKGSRAPDVGIENVSRWYNLKSRPNQARMTFYIICLSRKGGVYPALKMTRTDDDLLEQSAVRYPLGRHRMER